MAGIKEKDASFAKSVTSWKYEIRATTVTLT
jgi:hypothetical protein